MATGKEVREALRKARKAGVRVSRLRNSHWFLEKDGASLQVPFSPGSAEHVKQVCRKIRKFAEESTNA